PCARSGRRKASTNRVGPASRWRQGPASFRNRGSSPMSTNTPKRRQHGMTLLELMAVVTVIGVLGMIAIPSYRQYVMRAHRTEAKAALLQLQTNQERFYLTNRTYGTAAQLIAANLLRAGGLSERGTYQIT